MSHGRYRDLHAAQYGLSTVGNDCKWAATHPQEDTYTLDACIYSLQYAVNNTQVFRGHNLCWGNDNPEWLTCGAPNDAVSNCNWTATDLERLLVDHIENVMHEVPAGGATIYAWDVVNEAIDYVTHQAWGLKNNTWYPTLPNYVDVAFTAARQADPNALLCYNDYSAEGLSGKSDAVYDMVSSMITRGVPIDCVGFQLHVKYDAVPLRDDVSANIARLGDLGLVVHVTELDVTCPECYYYTTYDDDDGGNKQNNSGSGSRSSSRSSRRSRDARSSSSAMMLVPNQTALAMEATVYGEMLLACLENPGVCTSFETWGFTDSETWLGTDEYPLPFDVTYTAKPAYQTMMDILANATKSSGEEREGLGEAGVPKKKSPPLAGMPAVKGDFWEACAWCASTQEPGSKSWEGGL